jgi:hypothetical protein
LLFIFSPFFSDAKPNKKAAAAQNAAAAVFPRQETPRIPQGAEETAL